MKATEMIMTFMRRWGEVGGGGGSGLKSQLELGSLGKSLDKNVVVFICRTLLYCTAQHRTAKRDRSYVDTSRFLTGC